MISCDLINAMKFQVTSIEFDFSDAAYPVSDEYKSELYKDVLGDIWEVRDEKELLEEITADTGWCIKSIVAASRS